MKKILIIALLTLFTTFTQAQNCSSFGSGDICSNFPKNSTTYANCCACGPKTKTTGCPAVAAAPINSSLIFLIIISVGLGAGMINKHSKQQTAINLKY